MCAAGAALAARGRAARAGGGAAAGAPAVIIRCLLPFPSADMHCIASHRIACSFAQVALQVVCALGDRLAARGAAPPLSGDDVSAWLANALATHSHLERLRCASAAAAAANAAAAAANAAAAPMPPAQAPPPAQAAPAPPGATLPPVPAQATGACATRLLRIASACARARSHACARIRRFCGARCHGCAGARRRGAAALPRRAVRVRRAPPAAAAQREPPERRHGCAGPRLGGAAAALRAFFAPLLGVRC
jgi:hypothetical protein